MNRFVPMLAIFGLAACAHTNPPEETLAPESVDTSSESAEVSEPPPVAETAPEPPPVELPPANPVDLPPSRPCMVRIEPRSTDSGPACITLDRVQPESVPLGVCFGEPTTLRFRYDAEARIVESPSGTYTHRTGGRATWSRGRERIALTFDEAHRLIQRGRVRYRYDDAGRLVRIEESGHHLAYVYGADDTYTTEHDYPDSDEFCVADRVEVTRDTHGRVATDRYDNCGINEIPRTLAYRYDEAGALVGVDVDLLSDGSVEVVLTLSTTCDD